MIPALLIGIGLLLLGAFLYWQLILAEGTYLGPRVVALLYDWSARIYNRIKEFSPEDEQWFLGMPLARALELVPTPLVLDVATGTGRLPATLLRDSFFDGRVVALDLSRRMLKEAVDNLPDLRERLTFIWQNAVHLPFNDSVFDAVTCLEALEFTPDPLAVLRELLRVLRPGGVLLISNRVGSALRTMPGHTFGREQLAEQLHKLPLESVRIQSWQMDYDLVWAVKAGSPHGGGVRPLPELLRCPVCEGHPLAIEGGGYRCPRCGRHYPVAPDGVIEMAHVR